MATTILGWLTEDALEDVASPGALSRGEDISPLDVTILSATESEVQAAVQGTWPYRTTLTVQGNGVVGTCNCPVGSPWCKHAVAVALALLASKDLSFDDSESPDGAEADAVDTYLESATPYELRQIIEQLRQIPEVQEFLEFTALKQSGDDKQVREHVKQAITAASRKSSGFRDYWQTMEVARHWDDALDVAEAYLDEHRGVAVRPQIERAIARLNAILEHADDSSGMLGEQLHRCFDMHVRACADGIDNQKKLADWLVKVTWDAPFVAPSLRDYAGLLDATATDSIAAAFEQNPPEWGADRIAIDIAFLRGDDKQIESLLLERNSVKELIEFYESRGRTDDVKAVLTTWNRFIRWSEVSFFEERLRSYLGDEVLLDYLIAQFQRTLAASDFSKVLHAPGVTKDVVSLIPEDDRGRATMLLDAAMRFDDPDLGLPVVDSEEVDSRAVFDFARSVLASRDPERALEIMLREPENIVVDSGDAAYKKAAATAMEIISCFPDDAAARDAVHNKMGELAVRYKNRPKMLKIWRGYRLID